MKMLKGRNMIIAVLIFSIASLIIQSAQIFSNGYILGVDSIFHMNRIYETMMQIRTGQFSYFISLFSYEQSGRIVNALYGPGMAYLLGSILLYCKSWIHFQLITSFLINVIGAYGVYKISKKMASSNLFAILVGIIYMSTYFVSSWNVAGSFTGVGNMLIPYVIYYGIEMVTNEHFNFSIVGLGLSMGILLQTHIFSSLLSTLVLAPFIIYALIMTEKKWSFIKNICLSVLIAVFLSLNVWIGMYQVFSENYLLQTVPLDLLQNSVYFSPQAGTSQANIGLFLTVLLFLPLVQTMMNWRNQDNKIRLLVCTGGFFLVLSSRFFPWEFFSRYFPVLESVLQFPSRFIIVPTILFLSSLHVTVRSLKKKNLLVIVIIGMIFSVSNAQNRILDRMGEWRSENVLASPNRKPESISSTELRNSLRNDDLGEIFKIVQKGTSDYLPLKESITNQEFETFDPYSKYWEYVIRPNNQFDKTVEDGQLVISWESDTESDIGIPVFKYHQTVVKDGDTGKEVSYTLSDIGTIIVHSNIGLNKIIVSYPTSSIIMMSIVLALMTLFVCLGSMIFMKLQR